LAVGGFGNFVLPLQIGAPDMAFPRINLASYWFYAVGGVIMLASFFAPGGGPMSGWTSYPPLADFAPSGQTFWLFGMLCLIFSSLLGALNFIATIVQLRAPGLSWFRLPYNIWVGRMLPPSDRANLYGPYYSNEWATFTDGLQDGYPFVSAGRDNGVLYWGQFNKIKASGGVFDGPTATGEASPNQTISAHPSGRTRCWCRGPSRSTSSVHEQMRSSATAGGGAYSR